LFAEFEKYYRVDPRAWHAAPPQPEPQLWDEGGRYGHWR
jgi:hypothetical protein